MSAELIGATCRLGKGAARWEILELDGDASRGYQGVKLSKVGGDGYTNRWVDLAEVNNIQPPAAGIPTLGDVISARDALEEAAERLLRRVRSHGTPEHISELLGPLMSAHTEYDYAHTCHNNPHLTGILDAIVGDPRL